MSLKWKINLILAWSFALLALTIWGVQRLIVYPSFVNLENTQSIEEMTRCIDGIRREIDHLSITCADWASWDDTCKFVKDLNPEYDHANLEASSFSRVHIDVTAFLDMDRHIVWAGMPDASGETVIAAKDFVAELMGTPSLLPRPVPNAVVSGMQMTSRGAILICIRPIMPRSNIGPAVGYLIMGRLFSEKEVAGLAERARVPLRAWPINDALGAEQRAKLAAVSGRDFTIFRDRSETLSVVSTYPSIDSKPVLLLRADLPASISGRGAMAMRLAVITAVAMGALIVALMMVSLHRGVVRPLAEVTRHATKIASDDDLTTRLGMTRNDEIGRLAREFDKMVDHLAASRGNQLDVAHRAGMSEIASEVLHNVGNALNTVNTSAQVLNDKLRKSRLGGLGKATSLLAEQKADLPGFFANDRRSTKLIDYLIDLSDACSCEQQSMLQEVSTLKARIEHINEVISLQQSYATQTALLQNLDITKLLDDAVAMHAELFTLYDIGIDRQYQEVPAASINKSKVMQVLINLVKNGIESMIAAGELHPRMDLAARVEDDHLLVEVTDNGLGIDPAKLASLFRSGFTTKPNGHGFGLHFCANAIREMSGSLTARSEGVGRGATFRIQLPLTVQKVNT